MRKFAKGVSVALALTLTVGMLAGCSNKTKDVTYDYVAGDYIELGAYKGLEVAVGDYTVNDESLQKVIDQILDKHLAYNEVNREAKKGDKVNVKFDAYISGGRVEGFSSEDHMLVIGSNEFLVDGLEEAMIGLKAGDKRAITGLKVPEDFATEAKYAGRAITFDVEVISVNEPIRPAYDDAFVNTITGGDFTTVEDYNKELTRMLEENAVTNTRNDKYNGTFSQIVAGTKVIKEFPAEYIGEKTANLEEEISKFLPLVNMSKEEYLLKYYGKDNVEEIVNDQILLELIMQQIIEEEKLVITEKEYNEKLVEAAKARGYSSSEKFVEALGEDGVVKCMLVDEAVELILESAVEK